MQILVWRRFGKESRRSKVISPEGLPNYVLTPLDLELKIQEKPATPFVKHLVPFQPRKITLKIFSVIEEPKKADT